MVPNMHMVAQEMGRVDRAPCTDGSDGSDGDNRYEIHISLNCLVALFIRIMQHPDLAERVTQLGAVFEVLVILVFGNPNTT